MGTNGDMLMSDACSLPPRVLRILRWLIEHQAEVEKPEQLTLTFDCAGQNVKVRKTEHDKAE